MHDILIVEFSHSNFTNRLIEQSRQTNNFIYRTGESRKTFFLNPTIAVKFNL